MPIPLLFLSDSVDAHSGLARITRDLAVHAAQIPEFRVATMGRGGRGTSRLPFPQYVIGDDDWGQSYLQECWMDFAHDQRGILFTVWDPSRVRYLVSPDGSSDRLKKFLNEGRFERWGYFPLDATGPNNRLSSILADTIRQYNRVCAYGLWGKALIERSIGREVDWMPHGVNFNAFQPRPKDSARFGIGLKANDLVIGMVATNQQRKDWGLACLLASQIKKERHGIKFWFHIDEPIRHWNLYALLQDYDIQDIVLLTETGTLSDKELSHYYSACDLTILPSSEGFGLPIVESLACGVPCIHSNYAGGAEHVPTKEWLVDPINYRMEGVYNSLRPIWRPEDWLQAILAYLDSSRWTTEECRRSVEHLDITKLGPVWKKFFLKGINL